MKKKIFRSCLVLILIGLVALTWFLWKPTQFESESYSGIKISCDRGSIKVPELRQSPNSKKIKLSYVRLNSFSDRPKSPIFFLAGGPGNDASSQAEHPFYLEHWAPFLESRDVILIDQRGVNKLFLLWLNLMGPDENVLVTEDNALQYFQQISVKAKKAFNRRGVNLDAYNSKESAYDVDDIRKHLGYDNIIPLGFSYGTHLGLSYLKYFESKIEKLILVGVEGLDQTFKMPLDLDRQFNQIAQRVAQDSVLSKRIPDLTELYKRVAAKLAANPVSLEVKNPIGLTKTIVVGKFGLDYILKRDLGDASDIPEFPNLLYSIDHDDYNSLTWFVTKRIKEFYAIPGMTLAMDMASGMSRNRKKEILAQQSESLFGGVSNFPFMDLHDKWNIADLGDAFRKQSHSDVTALFLSGSLDSNTPSHQGDSLLEYFKNGTHLVVQDAGHEQILYSRGMTETILSFLNNENVKQHKIAFKPLQFNPLKTSY